MSLLVLLTCKPQHQKAKSTLLCPSLAELSDATLAPSSVPASVVDALVDMLPNFPPGPAGVAVAGQGRSSPEDEAALELAILGALKQLVHSLMLPNAAGHPNVTPSTVCV